MTKKAAEIDKQNTFLSDIAITTKNEYLIAVLIAYNQVTSHI